MKNCVLILVLLPMIALGQFIGPSADPNGKYLDDPKYLLGTLYGEPSQKFFGELIVPLGNFQRDGRSTFSITYTRGNYASSNIYAFDSKADSFVIESFVPVAVFAAGDFNRDGLSDII